MSTQTSDFPEHQNATRGKSKRKKPVELWFRGKRGSLFREWWRFGRYRSVDEAKEVIRKKSHQLYWGEGDWHIGPNPGKD